MKKTLDFLKDYLSIIVLIPALIGGIYQLINIIYKVGFSYVRFFSVSQVIPDGLLVGMFILYFSIIIFFFNEILKFSTIYIDEIEGKYSKLIHIFLLFILLGTLSYKFIKSSPESAIGFILADFFWMSLIILTLCVISLIIVNLSDAIRNVNASKVFYWIFFTSYVIYFSIEIENKVEIINDKIIRDDQFYNPDILINRIIDKNNNTKVSLLYANRDYLFFGIEKNGLKQIIVEDAKKLTSLDDK